MAASQVICNEGKDAVTDILLSDVSTATLFDVLAIGTGTTAPAKTDTILTTYDQSAAAVGTQQTVTDSNDTMRLVYTFSFAGSKTITEAGFCNSADPGSGALLSHASFTGIAVTSSDTLQVTYNIQVKQGS